MDNQDDYDPDPWTVASLVVAGVAMFAQLAQLALQAGATGQVTNPKPKPTTENALRKLRDQVEDATRNTERLIRLFSRADLPSKPLQAQFRFGAGSLILSKPQLQQYRELVQQIALSAGGISAWALTLIEIDPDFAAQVGSAILIDVSNVTDRINRLHIQAPRNEVVLEECLDMFRSFIRILERLDHHN